MTDDSSEKVNPSAVAATIEKVSGGSASRLEDFIAVEEPLQIILGFYQSGRRARKNISVTMRTPGGDADLAVGFLFAEGIIQTPRQIARIRQSANIIQIDLTADARVDLSRLERNFYAASSCGVCGKSSIESIQIANPPPLPPDAPVFDAAVIHRLPDILRESQSVFGATGGLHAAALFDTEGNLISLREDVGRHNALDKLIGARFLEGEILLSDNLLMVSGRASFELAQKAIAAGIAILAAVGAPSSLAVDTARSFNMTLLGFVRDGRFNVYSGSRRIRM